MILNAKDRVAVTLYKYNQRMAPEQDWLTITAAMRGCVIQFWMIMNERQVMTTIEELDVHQAMRCFRKKEKTTDGLVACDDSIENGK